MLLSQSEIRPVRIKTELCRKRYQLRGTSKNHLPCCSCVLLTCEFSFARGPHFSQVDEVLRGKALQYIGPDRVADMTFTKIPDDKKSCGKLSDVTQVTFAARLV